MSSRPIIRQGQCVGPILQMEKVRLKETQAQRGSKSINSAQRARIQTQVHEIQTKVGHIYFYRKLAKRMIGISPFTYLGIWKNCDPTQKSTVFGRWTTTHMEIKIWKGGSGSDFAFLLATCSPPHPTGDSWGSLAHERQPEVSWETHLIRKICEHIRGNDPAS